MCLAIPGMVVEVAGDDAVVEIGSVRRAVNVGLLDGVVAPGDWVIVHVGFALARIDAAEAETTLALLGEALDAEDAIEAELGPAR